MEMKDKANRILFSGSDDVNEEVLDGAIRKYWTPEDMALEFFSVNDGADWEIRSGRIFMDSTVVRAAKQIDPEANDLHVQSCERKN